MMPIGWSLITCVTSSRRGCQDDSNGVMEGIFWSPKGRACVTHALTRATRA